MIPIGYWHRDTYVAERVGNFQDSVYWGPLLEQIWVR